MIKIKKNKLLDFEEEELLRYLQTKLLNTKSAIISSDSILDLCDLQMRTNNLLDDLKDIKLNAKFRNIRDELDELLNKFITVKTMINYELNKNR